MTRFRGLVGALLASASLLAHGAGIDSSMQSTAIEFYNQTLDHYFITIDAQEISDLDTGVHVGWKRTGLSFQAIKAGASVTGSVPVCRFYSQKLDTHFYAGTQAECDTIKNTMADTWQLESTEVFRMVPVDNTTGNCAAGTVPIYRLWNNRSDVNHRYTDTLTVFDQMVAKGYIPEGNGNPQHPVIFCMPAKTGAAPQSTNGLPNCAVYSSDPAPVAGATITLTAACSDSPSSYTWTGCSSFTSTCQATAAVPGTVTYGVRGVNAKGSGPQGTVDVAWASSGGATPNCTVSASATSANVNTPVTLTANCSQTPTSYQWMTCNFLLQSACNFVSSCPQTSASCTVTQASAGYAHYAVRGGNGAGTGNTAGVDVSWNNPSGGGTPPPSGGGGQPSCTLSASPSSPNVGGTVTVTASCTNSPSSFAWTNCVSPSFNNTCTDSYTQAGVRRYSLVASNASGNGAPAYVDVTWSAGVPQCTVGASKTNPFVGDTIVLTATCSGTPTAYHWSSNCSSTTATCQATSGTAGTVAYQVSADNSLGAGPASPPKSVTWSSPPTVAPTCTVAASPALSADPFVGQAVTLAATCDVQTDTYAWTGCTQSSTDPSKCTASASTPGAAAYTVTGTNRIGAGAASQPFSINWQQSTAPADYCGNYSGSRILRVTGTWQQGVRIDTKDYGSSFPAQAILVVKFMVPGTATGPFSSDAFSASVVQYGSNDVMRWVSLSKSPCDFRSVDRSGVSGPIDLVDDSWAYSPTQSVGGHVGSTAQMKPGETWYVNVWNHYGTSPTDPKWRFSCAAKKPADCPILVAPDFPR